MAAINKNFVVKHGIEVGDNLLYGDKNNLKVGIGTTTPAYTLDVRGGIGATSVSVGQTIIANAGVITNFTAKNLTVNGGTFTAGGSTGTNGQYLKSTATGIEWATFPTARTSDTFIATEGQTTFSFAYNVGFIDVFVNGARLTSSEFTATDGLTIILSTSCRDGDIVDVVGYAINGIGAGTSGISGITIRDEGITVGNSNAVTSINFVGASVTSTGTGAGVTVIINSGLGTDTNIETTGIITASKVRVGSATTFTEDLVVQGNARITGILTIGTASITIDGSSNTITVPNLVVTNNTTGVVASGVAVSVRDGGSDLGNASILDFGDNISVSLSAGIATITGAASAGAGGTWASNSVGIYTSRSVGIGTTNPTSALTVKGDTSLESLNVSGVTTIQLNTNYGSNGLDFISHNNNGKFRLGNDGGETTGRLSWVNSSNQIIATINGNQVNGALDIYNYQNSGAQDITLSAGGSVVLQHGGTNTKLQTLGAGVTVTGTTFTNNLSVSGIATISGDGTNAYLRYGSSNAYTNFVTTYNVSQVGGVSLISADANGVALSADTTLNAAYWRIRTLPTGAEVNGALNVSGVSSFRDVVNINPPSATPELNFGNGKLQIYHNGSTGVFRETAGFSGMYFQTDNEFKVQDDTGGKTRISANKNSSVDLYYNGNKKFETLGTGVTITGTTFTNQLSVSGVSTFSGDIKTNNSNIVLNDGDGGNNKIKLGAGSGGQDADCYISHTSAYGNVIQDLTGTGVRAITNNFRLSSPADISVSFFTASPTGSTELYYGSIGGYSSSKKLETLGAGVTITGTTFTNDLSVSGVSTFSGNVSVGIDTSTGLILTSPNGTRYRLIVADNGTLSTVPV